MWSSWVMNSSSTSFMLYRSPHPDILCVSRSVIFWAFNSKFCLLKSAVCDETVIDGKSTRLCFCQQCGSQKSGLTAISFHQKEYLLTAVIKKKKFWSGYPHDIMSLCLQQTCYMIPALKSSVLLGQNSNIASGLSWCSSQMLKRLIVFLWSLISVCHFLHLSGSNNWAQDNKPRCVLMNIPVYKLATKSAWTYIYSYSSTHG